MIKCCKDCNDRYPGCHSHCARYINEKAEDEAQKEQQRQRQFEEHLRYSSRAMAGKKKKSNKYSEV